MQISGQDMVSYGAGVLGTGPMPAFGAAAPALAISAPVAAPAAAPAPAAMATARQQQLLAGAAPVTAEEQAYVQRTSQAMQGFVALLQGVVAATARGGGPAVGGTREDNAWEQRVTDLINAERAKVGLGALRYSGQLDAAAEGHDLMQAATGTMAHEGLGDADPGSRIRAQGFSSAWGENVATGQTSPEQVVAEWMASPGHRRNILDPAFTQLGVAFTTGLDGRTYWAQSFGA